jgi:hypothetical protein
MIKVIKWIGVALAVVRIMVLALAGISGIIIAQSIIRQKEWYRTSSFGKQILGPDDND